MALAFAVAGGSTVAAPLGATTDAPAGVMAGATGPGGSALILRKVRLKANTARPGRFNGRFVMRGILNVNVPFADFPDDIISTGLTAFVDGAGISQVLNWSGANCASEERSPGRLFMACETLDRQATAFFSPIAGVVAPNVFKVKITARKLDLALPLTTDPITVILDTVDLDPEDTIGAGGGCVVKGTQLHVVNCKEKGIITIP
jgi:hypothetical protein